LVFDAETGTVGDAKKTTEVIAEVADEEEDKE